MARTKLGERGRPWVVFTTTGTHLIARAADVNDAWDQFCRRLGQRFQKSDHGRVIPPARDEVNIRPLREDDAAWIDRANDKQWTAALAAVKAAVNTAPPRAKRPA